MSGRPDGTKTQDVAAFVRALIAAADLGEHGSPMLDVALALVNAGWSVFPCGQDKAPLIPGGFKARSADPEQIKRWWLTHPDALPAILPGDGDLAALDVDSTAAATIVGAAGYLNESGGFVVLTGGTSAPFSYRDRLWDPMHVYIRATEQPKLPGVIVRFRSGYVIAPGARRGERVYRVASRDEPAAWTGDNTTTAVQTTPVIQSSQQAPDIERVRQAVACIPNEKFGREAYVGIAHMICGAVGEAGRDIFLGWADRRSDGPVDPAEDERVWDTLPSSRLGWGELWRVAAKHGFDATPETQADAQNDFEAMADAPAPRLRMSPSLSVRSFAEVIPTRIEWLLPGRVARQQITMINGWPGEGKTSVVIDIAARMTRAEQLPDGTQPPQPLRVLFLSTEDSQSILHLRLRGAGAKMDRVLTIPDTELQHLTLPSHKGIWVPLLRERQIDVVVVDPMKAFLDDGLKDIAEQDARKFMQALRQVCEDTNVAAICIRHPNKATASGHSTAVSAASGSLGFTAAARIELLVGRMPDDEDTRALAHVKNNLAKPPGALLYRIVSKEVSFDDGSMATEDVAGIEWLGVDDKVLAEELLAKREGREERTKLEDAREFLKKFLAAHPMEHTSVRSAANRHGIKPRTLERARSHVAWSRIVGNLNAGGKTIWGLEGQTEVDFVSANRTATEERLEPADLSDVEASAAQGVPQPTSERPSGKGSTGPVRGEVKRVSRKTKQRKQLSVRQMAK